LILIKNEKSKNIKKEEQIMVFVTEVYLNGLIELIKEKI